MRRRVSVLRKMETDGSDYDEMDRIGRLKFPLVPGQSVTLSFNSFKSVSITSHTWINKDSWCLGLSRPKVNFIGLYF